jgi:hypothetical protein
MRSISQIILYIPMMINSSTAVCPAPDMARVDSSLNRPMSGSSNKQINKIQILDMIVFTPSYHDPTRCRATSNKSINLIPINGAINPPSP